MLVHDCSTSCVKFIDVENMFLGPQENFGSGFLSEEKKPEKTQTFAILFNVVNVDTKCDFKSRDFSKTLQVPCQNGLNVGSNCTNRGGVRHFTGGGCYAASKEIASELGCRDRR